MIDTLRQQISEVARLRKEAQNNKDLVGMAKAAWEAEHAELLADASKWTEEVKLAEDRLRQMTLEVYEQTKDKHPAEGVSVRILTELHYDPAKAFAYAKEHGIALKLDTASFDKMSKVPELRPAFVTVEEVAQATIATDLSKELKEK